jgi:UDP-glucose 4-epimerase
MKLLVTGGAGYVGSVVAEFALGAGHGVTVIDTLQNGNRGAVPDGCDFIQGDIGDGATLDRVMGSTSFDAVIHMAAEAAIAPSVTDPALYFQANVAKGLVLLDAMRRHRIPRMVFSSTAATYGEPQVVPILEEHPLAPINAYGESKLMFERILAWYHRAYGLRAIALRYFNAAGATAAHGEDRRDESHLIPLVLSAALGRRPAVEVFGTNYPTGDGTCIRDYVHVSDMARAHLGALDQLDELGFETFNVAAESGSSVLDVIRTAESVTGRPIPRVVRPRRSGDPAVLVASAQKLRRVLRWQPRESALRTIVESAWNWRVQFPNGYAS